MPRAPWRCSFSWRAPSFPRPLVISPLLSFLPLHAPVCSRTPTELQVWQGNLDRQKAKSAETQRRGSLLHPFRPLRPPGALFGGSAERRDLDMGKGNSTSLPPGRFRHHFTPPQFLSPAKWKGNLERPRRARFEGRSTLETNKIWGRGVNFPDLLRRKAQRVCQKRAPRDPPPSPRSPNESVLLGSPNCPPQYGHPAASSPPPPEIRCLRTPPRPRALPKSTEGKAGSLFRSRA